MIANKGVKKIHRWCFPLQEIPGANLCYRLSQLQGHSAAGRIR
jgi:hypothetical protein